MKSLRRLGNSFALLASALAATLGLLSIVTSINWHSRQQNFWTPSGLTQEFGRRYDLRVTGGRVEFTTEKLIYVSPGTFAPLNPPPVINVLTLVNGQPTSVKSPPWVAPPMPRRFDWSGLGFEFHSGGGSRTNGPKAYISSEVETYQALAMPSWIFLVPLAVCLAFLVRRSRSKSRRGFDILPKQPSK